MRRFWILLAALTALLPLTACRGSVEVTTGKPQAGVTQPASEDTHPTGTEPAFEEQVLVRTDVRRGFCKNYVNRAADMEPKT